MSSPTPIATIGTAAAGPFGATVSAQTAANGELQVFVSLGNAVGQGTIAVDAPALGLHDTAHVTVKAGRLAKASVVPRDPAVFVGNPLKINYQLFDRAGNPVTRESPVIVSTSGVSATSTSGVFTPVRMYSSARSS